MQIPIMLRLVPCSVKVSVKACARQHSTACSSVLGQGFHTQPQPLSWPTCDAVTTAAGVSDASPKVPTAAVNLLAQALALELGRRILGLPAGTSQIAVAPRAGCPTSCQASLTWNWHCQQTVPHLRQRADAVCCSAFMPLSLVPVVYLSCKLVSADTCHKLHASRCSDPQWHRCKAVPDSARQSAC